jgi:hypothetical protein
MSDNPEPPPKSVVVDLQVAHLTKAVVSKSGIRFEFHLPEGKVMGLVDDLLHTLYAGHALPDVPEERFGPISVDEDKRGKSRAAVVYKPDRPRIPSADMPGIIGAFEEVGIPITSEVREGIQHAFAVFDELRAQEAGHAAAEAARRSAKKGPGGPER